MTDTRAAAFAPLPAERVVVISIDGLAPRSISFSTMPRLCRLAAQGASTFSASTVDPPLTLPAHASMLRGVPPERHGIRTNHDALDNSCATSFLRTAVEAGRTTAVVASWLPMLGLIEDDAITHRHTLRGGYGVGDDEVTVGDAVDVLARRQADVTFVYLTGPDLAGHAAGWGSADYLRAVARADRHLGRLIDALEPGTAVVVTTDHGGEDRDHASPTPAVMETFLVVRSRRIPARSVVDSASILDVAPTVADLCGASPHPDWTGRSVVDRCVPLEDWILDLVRELGDHDYGERVDMLSHSMQTAAVLRTEGGSDALVLAGLLHDVGHLIGEPTAWGVADHAELGARFLARWFGPAVTEPVLLHVAAKRYLVATDPDYERELSAASVATLEQQGGPFSPAAAAEFESNPMAAEAIRLRRADDAGKVPDGGVDDLEAFRGLIGIALDAATISSEWARDACECSECRDPGSGQHLIGAADVVGWTVVSARSADHGRTVELQHRDGRTHRCTVGPADHRAGRPVRSTWGREMTTRIRPGARDAADFAARLATWGIALVADTGSTPRTVLDFAGEIGFVRATNYGELFDVIAEATPTNLAFTNAGLPLHTDNPYRDPVPTVQLLHCLRSSETGGGSLFSDGFRAAEQLRASNRDHFDLLTATPVLFEYRDDAVCLRAEVPLIRLDARGDVDRITVNNRSMRAVELGDRASDFYEAYAAFAEALAHPDNTVALDLRPGEIIGFDNRRVLHGRSAYGDGGARHLQGCYIDIDAIHSMNAVNAMNA